MTRTRKEKGIKLFYTMNPNLKGFLLTWIDLLIVKARSIRVVTLDIHCNPIYIYIHLPGKLSPE